MTKSVFDLLTVYIDGDELPGLIFYGLEALEHRRSVQIPFHAWPAVSAQEEHVLQGDHWRVQMWTVALERIPPPGVLEHGVAATLQAFIEAGCVVAWVAFEGNFCDPPALFSPECMSGGVVTALNAKGKRWNKLDARGRVTTLTDDELLELRADAELA
jgi:hypothetical protein